MVRPGGGLEGAATDRPLGGKGTFHSSWAREELDTEPPPGDHFESLGLAVGRKKERKRFLCYQFFHKTCVSDELNSGAGKKKKKTPPEVLCAVLVRELLWLEARMDDQALLEGIVVFSDEDGPKMWTKQ